jgi:hypothetical protein
VRNNFVLFLQQKGLPKLDDIQLQQEELPKLNDGGLQIYFKIKTPIMINIT